MNTITLDGRSLSIADLVRVARDPRVKVACAPKALARVAALWKRIVKFAANYEKNWQDPKNRIYGVTTGFGEFKDKFVPPEQLQQLQRNLLLSHAVGIGESSDEQDPTNYFAGDVVRAALVVRLNTLLRGHSGVSPELVSAVTNMINLGVIPRAPIRGSVGSSGDLCPLCHTFIVLMGEGHYYIAKTPADLTIRSRDWIPGRKAPAAIRYEPRWKEGLGLSNGATYSAAMLALAVHDAEILADSADLAAALTLEAMCGRTRAFDPRVHAARGMKGQTTSAANILKFTKGSQWIETAAPVQDAYSLRCAPQVHGASRDAIEYARGVAEAEINAVTDNPLFFDGEEGAFSQGNFHGQPIALAGDFLGIALAEIANISERRGQMVLDQAHNRNLPANLIPLRGVNSGYMIAQYTAAGLVSENKVLAHPASVDSIPTSANSEDHNSMSTIACRKLRTILGNAQTVVGIELMIGAQAVEWRTGVYTNPNGRAHSAEGTGAAGSEWEQACAEEKKFINITKKSARTQVAKKLGAGTGQAYLRIRESVEPMLSDRYLSADVHAARKIVESGALFA